MATEGILPASITVLTEDVPPVPASINTVSNDVATSAHDVIKTILPDILADIAPDLPKGKLDKYIENIKNHIPEDIAITVPDTYTRLPENTPPPSSNIAANIVRLGLSNIGMTPKPDDHVVDIQPIFQPASNASSTSSHSDTSSHHSTPQGWLAGLVSLIQGNSPTRRKSKTKFCIIKKGTNELDKEILGYIRKINETIGYYWWKQYFYTGFWSYITTPINLAITVITALTTGQSATNGLISSNSTTVLGGIALLLSIFNTFFKPNDQYNLNKNALKQWADIGTSFDEIYFDKVSDDNHKDTEKREKLSKLQDLFKKVSNLKKNNESNFLIDIIFIILRCICLRNDRILWSQDISADDEEDI